MILRRAVVPVASGAVLAVVVFGALLLALFAVQHSNGIVLLILLALQQVVSGARPVQTLIVVFLLPAKSAQQKIIGTAFHNQVALVQARSGVSQAVVLVIVLILARFVPLLILGIVFRSLPA